MMIDISINQNYAKMISGFRKRLNARVAMHSTCMTFVFF